MLARTRTFFRTTLLGGVIVILPAIILFFAFRWLFGIVGNAIKPLTDLVVGMLTLPGELDNLVATLIVVSVIILGCFLVGLFVKTRIGRWTYDALEHSVLSRAPGYKMVKETVNQFLGKNKSPFSTVVLVQLFENSTMATAFITDRQDDGTVTVFVPTAPNPTSGFIYHAEQKYVHPLAVSVESAMRSVISCGAGSGTVLGALKKSPASAPVPPAAEQ